MTAIIDKCSHQRKRQAPRPFLPWRLALLASICARIRASRCSSSDGSDFWTLAGVGAEVVGTCAGRWASPSMCRPT